MTTGEGGFCTTNNKELYDKMSMLQAENPGDYVIATDETHTVEEFLKYAFEYIDMDYHAREN